MKARFSSRFKDDLDRHSERYMDISPRLAGDFRERIAGLAREVIRWGGEDHEGPHGYPCRRAKPFPFYLYYTSEADTILFLALVHEKRHPNHLANLKTDAG